MKGDRRILRLKQRNQRVEVATGSNQNGDGSCGAFVTGIANQLKNNLCLALINQTARCLFPGFGIAVAADHWVDADAGVVKVGLFGHCRAKTDRAAGGIVLIREHLIEGVVHPCNDVFVGTVVLIKL